MKKITLIFTLLILSLSVFSQSDSRKEIITKGSNVTLEEGTVFQSDTIRYDNGSLKVIKNEVFDSATSRLYYLSTFRAKSNSVATDMKAVWQLKTDVDNLISLDTLVERTLGYSPIDSIQKADDPPFNNWILQINGVGTDTIGFRDFDGVKMQWSMDTSSFWRTAIYIGDVWVLYDLNDEDVYLGKVVSTTGTIWRSPNRHKSYAIKQD